MQDPQTLQISMQMAPVYFEVGGSKVKVNLQLEVQPKCAVSHSNYIATQLFIIGTKGRI